MLVYIHTYNTYHTYTHTIRTIHTHTIHTIHTIHTHILYVPWGKRVPMHRIRTQLDISRVVDHPSRDSRNLGEGGIGEKLMSSKEINRTEKMQRHLNE